MDLYKKKMSRTLSFVYIILRSKLRRQKKSVGRLKKKTMKKKNKLNKLKYAVTICYYYRCLYNDSHMCCTVIKCIIMSNEYKMITIKLYDRKGVGQGVSDITTSFLHIFI